MSGSWLSALAIITRRFMPPDRIHHLGLALVPQRQASQQILDIGRRRADVPNRPREKLTVFHTVSNASVVSSCGTRPIRRARMADSRSASPCRRPALRRRSA